MKLNIKLINILVIIGLFSALFIPTVGYSFGGHETETNYVSGDRNTGVILDTGANNIQACHYYEFRIRVWNDPTIALKNVRSDVILPKIFDNSGAYASTETNYADGIAPESDTDTLQWLASANGQQFKFIPGSAIIAFNSSTAFNAYNESNLSIVDQAGNLQKLTFNTLPDLNNANDYIFLKWEMQTGGNCINLSKTLTSDANKIYNAGDQVTYELTLNNTGNYAFRNINVTDNFDSAAFTNNVLVESLDTNPVRAISGLSVNNGVLNFNLGGTLYGSAILGPLSTKVKLTFTVKPDFQGVRACNVSGSVRYDDYNGLFIANTSSFTSASNLCVNLFNANPSLKIAKSLSTFIKETNRVVYEIRVDNTGDVNVNNARIKDFFDSTKYNFLTVYEGNTQVPSTVTSNPNQLYFDIGTVGTKVTRAFFLSFDIKGSGVSGQACNLSATIDGTYTNGGTTSNISNSYNTAVCVDILNPAVNVVKRLVSSSISSLEYTVDVKNTGNTVLNAVSLSDTYDTSRLVLSSTIPSFDTNTNGVISINNILGSGEVLNPGQTKSIDMKFNVKANAPVGLACNLSVSVNAKDVNSKNVTASYTVPQDTMNCVNLTVILPKNPYFSISKRVVSNNNALVGDIVQWEIVVRNICNGTDCIPAKFLQFKDNFDSTKLTFNSAFAQLKNADGTNVNANPIQFTPTSITTDNGQTVIIYSNVVSLTGEIGAGQYVVFNVYTTAKATSDICVLNTGTAIGDTNTVSASACVNIGAVQGATTTTVNLPRTDGLDVFGFIKNLPSNLQLAVAISILGLLLGMLVPSALLVKSKRVE
ncbi:MAG: hypothetical protein WCO33_03020 [bacterium]